MNLKKAKLLRKTVEMYMPKGPVRYRTNPYTGARVVEQDCFRGAYHRLKKAVSAVWN